MEQIQVQKLKINATNIKNSLVSYNKQLIKLRKDEARFLFTETERQQAEQKENKIERGSISKSVESIKSKILSGPLGFFDKVKEFFGIVLLGLLINNLPKIIESLKKFFSENKWIIDATKFTLKIIGDGIMGIIWLVDKYPKAVMQNIDKEREKLKTEVDKLVNVADGVYNFWNNLFGFNNPQQTSSTASPQSQPSGPSSTLPSPTVVGSIPVTKPSTNTTPQTGTPSRNTPVQKFAKGGTVKPQATKTTVAGGFRGTTPSPLGRRAIESVDSFEGFNQVASGVKLNSILLGEKDGVNDTFSRVNESFRQFLDLFANAEKGKPFPTPTPPGTPRVDDPFSSPTAIKLDPSDVIGTVGYTGRVIPAGPGGSHIHIEDYSTPGGGIPTSVKSNILVNGKPMTSALRFSSGIGMREGKLHAGEDYAGNPGQSITLTGGLKFVRFVPQGSDSSFAGYGNVVVIQDANGKKYFLGHLNSGPTPELIKKIKDQQKKVDVVAPAVRGLVDQLLRPEYRESEPEVSFVFTRTRTKVMPFPVIKEVNKTIASNNNYSESSALWG
jgi:hypothetical protein